MPCPRSPWPGWVGPTQASQLVRAIPPACAAWLSSTTFAATAVTSSAPITTTATSASHNPRRRTGNQLGFFITEPNHGDYVLRLKSARHRTGEEIADDLRQRIGVAAPGIEIEFGQLVEDVIGDLTTSPQPWRGLALAGTKAA